MSLRNTFGAIASICLLAAAPAWTWAASDGGGLVAAGNCATNIVVVNADDDGVGSLRQAVRDVCPGGTIRFAARYAIALQSEIVVDRAFAIDGSDQSAPLAAGQDNLVQILGGADHRSFRIDATGDLTLSQLRLSDGHTTGLGGAVRVDGRLAVDECRFDANSTGNDNGLGGGAIYVGLQGVLRVAGSTFDHNDALRGSAIFNSGDAELRNSTFSDNRGSTDEGAIQNRNSLLAIHITVADNGADNAGFGGLFAFQAVTTLINSVVADNVGLNCFKSGGTLSATALLAESGNCAQQFVADPQLQALSANGGITATRALAAGSSAIDVADAAFCLPTDQRGMPRPQSAGCDLGAVEFPADLLFADGFESP